MFTAALAARCDGLLAADGSETPLRAARDRLANLPHVALERGDVLEGFPPGSPCIDAIPSPDYPQTGDAVHAALAAQPGLGRLVEHVKDDFRLEVYLRTPPAVRSVAAQTVLR